MTKTAVQKINSLAYFGRKGKVEIKPEAKIDVRRAVISFLDMAATATGQSTFYNTKQQQQDAAAQIHDAVFAVNRGLYAAMLMLPGVNDYSLQKGIQKLLESPHPENGEPFIPRERESEIIGELSQDLPAQRLFKMFRAIKEARINNKRARNLILGSVLGSDRLPLWSVKYRTKLRAALQHAWGVRDTSIICSIVAKDARKRTASEKAWLAKQIDRYALSRRNTMKASDIYQCVGFIFDVPRSNDYTVDMLRAFYDARKDIKAGSILPHEVLEGIRGRFHPTVTAKVILEMTKDHMTEGQKITLQRTAEKANVRIDFDPSQQDMVRLYVYAMERGMTKDIRRALDEKAKKAARTFPIRYDKVAIVLDTSESMKGGSESANRPVAVALAMRDILTAVAEEAHVFATGGTFDENKMVVPSGDTQLAEAFVDAMETEPDAVFMITDGYENAPAGRTSEMIVALRQMGIETPVYQIVPVMASEAAGVRAISPGISPLAVQRPEAIGMTLVRSALEADIETGIKGLLGVAGV